MKHLFIDSNIWLSLYHFTNDDLEQFAKLESLLNKEIKLYIPRQVKDEVLRNRESKLSDMLKTFNLNLQFPAFCKGYDDYASFKGKYSTLSKEFNTWKKKIETDISNESLPADSVIRKFFTPEELIPCDDYINLAFNRYRLGNPPGKDNSYGDAINWECLLDKVPDGEDLYIVSLDNDYRSLLNKNSFRPFLIHEWKEKKHASVYYYSELVQFLKSHVKEIDLKCEKEKQDLIQKLYDSPNFVTTHGIIAMLNKLSGWSNDQIEKICAAVEDNFQVGWILGDTDVQDFYSSLLKSLNYNELPDCATKRVMNSVFGIADDNEVNIDQYCDDP